MVLLALFSSPILYFIFKAKKGTDIFVRKIPGVNAIDEAIGRSVELGRPLSFTTAMTSIGPLLAACLGVLSYIAKKTANYGSRLFVPLGDPEAVALADVTLQNAYREVKKYAVYDPTSLRFLSSEQFAFASGYMGIVEREKVGAAFLFGSFAAESLILAEAGQKANAVQIAATTDTHQIPFFIASCDYTLIGEELFAASSYLSKDPVQQGSLRGQDFAKLIVLFLVLIGVLEATYYSIKEQKLEKLHIEALLEK